MEDLDYDLRECVIGETGVKKREESRLLVVRKDSGEVRELDFRDVMYYFECGDRLVVNDRGVMAGRLFGVKEESGGKVEMVMVREI
ncbi:S-adenosylmethionine:tRNA ribosyltransferase-isomerase, partial [Staphylococcus epidermidis]|uniref:S-adenosylmethionine:tRNA ribosyltransferase-isomerase n=1 Tax=Staphylococcus epidermidis TaxID=1282 RepID=UPI0021B2DD54